MLPALSLHSISKRFGTLHALSGVDFAVAPGSIHALLGENGAGKSTLMHIAFGMLGADSGEILVRGEPVLIRSPRDARRLGIGMVHQHFASVESMTVLENLRLVMGGAGGPEGRGAGNAPATSSYLSPLTSYLSLLTSHALAPDARVETLSVAQKQRLEIVKALATGARILLLDEPTAVLAPPEVDELLRMLRRFADEGGAVVLITHKLREVLAVADRVTVLRRGRAMLRGPVAGQTEEGLAEVMVGDGGAGGQGGSGAGNPHLAGGIVGAGPARPAEAKPSQNPAGHSGGMPAQGPGFEVRAGEIVGIAAVEGNGQRELLRAVAGIDPRRDVVVTGVVAFVPEDRATEGLIADLSLTENLVLGLGADAPWIHGGLVDWGAARAWTAELLGQHEVHAAGPDAPARSLSGGNQQKVIMARAFARHPDVLVVENPTRGLDIRASTEVHRRLREAATSGMAVLVWSSDLDEVLEIADRVLVVRNGVVTEAPAGADRAQVGRMMLGAGEVSGER